MQKKGTRRNDEILRQDKTSQAASQEYFFGGLDDDDDDETSSGNVSSCSRVSSLSFLYATFIFSINYMLRYVTWHGKVVHVNVSLTVLFFRRQRFFIRNSCISKHTMLSGNLLDYMSYQKKEALQNMHACILFELA